MQSENPLFADLAKLMNSAAGTMAGMTREAREGARERIKSAMGGMDFVARDEFDRHVRSHEQRDQQREGGRGEQPLRDARRPHECGEVVLARPDEGDPRDQRQASKRRRDPEQSEAEFGDHLFVAE